jgi:hypothetical protein
VQQASQQPASSHPAQALPCPVLVLGPGADSSACQEPVLQVGLAERRGGQACTTPDCMAWLLGQLVSLMNLPTSISVRCKCRRQPEQPVVKATADNILTAAIKRQTTS